MEDLKKYSSEDLVKELKRRRILEEYCPKCRGKWTTYLNGGKLFCHGCWKPVDKCTC
jgi:hypothetical protein